jgi:hypothetical protein
MKFDHVLKPHAKGNDNGYTQRECESMSKISNGPGCAGGTAIWTEVEKAKADAYEDAAQRVEKLAEDYTHEHGSYDPSTNAWELHHRHGDRIEAWDDAVEAIRKRKAEKCHVTHASQQSAPSYAPRRLPGPLWEIVMHDQDFQDSLLDYYNYGGSSARVAKAAMKAIGGG